MAQIEAGSPIYGLYQTLQKQLTSIEKYQEKENYSTMKTYLSFAQKTIEKIKQKDASIDISSEEEKLAKLQREYNEANQPEDNTELEYFKRLYSLLNSIYSDTESGADAADGLKFYSAHTNLSNTVERFKDFTIDDYYRRVTEAKSKDNYQKMSFFIDRISEALEDYPRFIDNSQGTFSEYIRWLNNIGVKGDPSQELLHLEATKTFCELLLKFAPNNSRATQWLKDVELQISDRRGSIVYASSMHEKHLNEMLFSRKEISIGNETENDFTDVFGSEDYIFATVYLPAKLRTLTDSYAANDVQYKINGSMIVERSMSAVWVTTEMQEKNYLQFAIIPSPAWKQKYGKYYTENKLRTHEHILNGILRAGPYSGTTLEVEVTFRGTHSKIKGSCVLNLSDGLDKYKSILASEEDDRLGNEYLPKAGMSNAGLESQALGIMTRKSEGSGKQYHKAIITSPNWDYNSAWNGSIISRSVVIAMVSTEHDGKCMYQYFNFTQQARGDGSYNDNLELDGAGDNYYLSCKNAK